MFPLKPMVLDSPTQSQDVPDSPRGSQTDQEIPRHSNKLIFFTISTRFKKGNRLIIISTARCSRRSSVSKFSDNLLLKSILEFSVSMPALLSLWRN